MAAGGLSSTSPPLSLRAFPLNPSPLRLPPCSPERACRADPDSRWPGAQDLASCLPPPAQPASRTRIHPAARGNKTQSRPAVPIAISLALLLLPHVHQRKARARKSTRHKPTTTMPRDESASESPTRGWEVKASRRGHGAPGRRTGGAPPAEQTLSSHAAVCLFPRRRTGTSYCHERGGIPLLSILGGINESGTPPGCPEGRCVSLYRRSVGAGRPGTIT